MANIEEIAAGITVESAFTGREEPQDIEPRFEIEEQKLDEVVEQMTNETLETEGLSDVEERLEEANHYRALLNTKLFKGDSSPITTKVETEVRDFIKEKLRVLVGIKKDKTAETKQSSVFTEDEIKALKMLAGRVLPSGPKQPPAINQTEVELKPAPEKVKIVKKKKEEEKPNQIEVQLPNGMVVKTTATPRKKGPTPQEIADAASRAAEREAARSPDPISNIITSLRNTRG